MWCDGLGAGLVHVSFTTFMPFCPACPDLPCHPPSSTDATSLLAGTGPELLNGSIFVATDTALETKLAKWVPSLADDLASVPALQSPQ